MKIEGLRKELREKAEAECEEIRTQGTRESRDILERGSSAANLLSRRMLLEAKQEILAELLQKAQESVYEMEEGAYFRLLERIAAKKRPAQGRGDFVLSQRQGPSSGYI